MCSFRIGCVLYCSCSRLCLSLLSPPIRIGLLRVLHFALFSAPLFFVFLFVVIGFAQTDGGILFGVESESEINAIQYSTSVPIYHR